MIVPRNQILIGDVRDGLRNLPDGCVQCVVTSPPYWGLRQYLFDGASIVRRDLPEAEREWLMQQLEKHGIQPKSL